jgi:hypothetical protein
MNRLLYLLLVLALISGCTPQKAYLAPGEEIQGKVVTRAAFAHLLVTRLNLESIKEPSQRIIITDISQNPYRKDIKKITGLKIMEVYPNHTFLPDKALSRGESAKIVENILVAVKNKEKWRTRYLDKPSPFSDVPNYHRHFNAIMLAAKRNIIKPYRDGSFRPGQLLSPSEAKGLIRKLERYLK